MRDEMMYFSGYPGYPGERPRLKDVRPYLVMDLLKTLARPGDSNDSVKANISLAGQYVDAVLADEDKRIKEMERLQAKRNKVERLRYTLEDQKRALKSTQAYRQETIDKIKDLEKPKFKSPSDEKLWDRLAKIDKDILTFNAKIVETEKALHDLDLGEEPNPGEDVGGD